MFFFLMGKMVKEIGITIVDKKTPIQEVNTEIFAKLEI
jgi:hypothetical protein